MFVSAAVCMYGSMETMNDDDSRNIHETYE
jgi:hypothetical protein